MEGERNTGREGVRERGRDHLDRRCHLNVCVGFVRARRYVQIGPARVRLHTQVCVCVCVCVCLCARESQRVRESVATKTGEFV